MTICLNCFIGHGRSLENEGMCGRESPWDELAHLEFGIVADEIMFGLDQSVAVSNLAPRVGHSDLSFFSTAVNIQLHTGGNLGEILSRLSRMLRSRSKLRLKIRALSSEGRLSAIALSLLISALQNSRLRRTKP